ncbi:transglycosylase family protein [Streptomyces sp. FXJ1.4098]|nr:transglycosylase family protein [Streptomyces sp. FXJ1.4098]
MTGASIAMPLFGAVGAQAADTTQTWDRVAECESGGMWSANGGNGFYGGLQITLDMWKKYGGQQYAPRPDLASRSQQIAIAQAILADRGPDAWPSCALDAGLAGLADALDVNPGGKGTPEAKDSSEPTGIDDSDTDEASDNSSRGDRSDSSDSSGSSEDSDTSDKVDKPDPSATPDDKSGEKGEKSGDSDEASRGKGDERSDRDAKGEDSATSPTGRHRGAPDAREQDSAGTADDDTRSSGRHASRDDAEHTETPVQPLGREDYTVRGGDNLSDIADDQKVDGGWPKLYEANEPLIGTDPDLIHPGQRLDLSAR